MTTDNKGAMTNEEIATVLLGVCEKGFGAQVLVDKPVLRKLAAILAAQPAQAVGMPVGYAIKSANGTFGSWLHSTEEQAIWRLETAIGGRPDTSSSVVALGVIAPVPAEQHPDNAAVDRFAESMKDKMAYARTKGRSGWDNPEECDVGDLAAMLVSHIGKGDPVDVANFCMMLHQRGADNSVLSEAWKAFIAPVTAEPTITPFQQSAIDWVKRKQSFPTKNTFERSIRGISALLEDIDDDCVARLNVGNADAMVAAAFIPLVRQLVDRAFTEAPAPAPVTADDLCDQEWVPGKEPHKACDKCGEVRQDWDAAPMPLHTPVWQPIETAPKDGRACILFARWAHTTTTLVCVGSFFAGEWRIRQFVGENNQVIIPSRWMPVPQAPGTIVPVLSAVKEVEALRELCAAAYIMAGALDAPERFLDALSDAANGEIQKRRKTDSLLPVDCPEPTALVTRVELIEQERIYVGYEVENARVSYQDEGRTLKVFIQKRKA